MSLNLSCHFDNLLYLILGTIQDDVDDNVDVGDVDFAIAVHVGSRGAAVSAQNHVDGNVHISNVHFMVAVNVTHEYVIHNLFEIQIPVRDSTVGIGHPLQHMKRTTRVIPATQME